jgi:hypothetical protein
MDQLDSTCRAPPRRREVQRRGEGIHRYVVVRFEFESAKFETGFSLDRFNGWNQALSSYGSNDFNLHSPTARAAV